MSGEHGQPLGLPAPVRRSLLAVLVVAVAVASDACDASVGDAAALAAAVKRAGSDACVGRTSTVAVTADIALAAPVHVWANASVSLVGPRAISGAGDHGLFVTRGRLALSGLRLADGAAASGGCVFVGAGGSLAASNASFVRCAAANYGGAIYASGAEVALRNVSFAGVRRVRRRRRQRDDAQLRARRRLHLRGHDRDARRGGRRRAGAHDERGDDRRQRSTRSAAAGGALYVEDESNCSVSRSLFRATSAASSGGAVALVGGGSLAVEDTVLAPPRSAGGAVLMSGAPLRPSARPSTGRRRRERGRDAGGLVFRGSVAETGGGGGAYLRNVSGSLVVRDAVFAENRCRTSGGGLFVEFQASKPSVARCPVEMAGQPCAYAKNGTWRSWDLSSDAAVVGSTFVGNEANFSAGGLGVTGGARMSIEDTSFHRNSARMLGGGLMVGQGYVRTAVDLTTARVSFEDNAAILGASFYSETGFLTSLYVWMGNTMDLDATSGVRCAVGTTIASQFVVPAPFNFTPFVFWSNGELCPDVKENAIGSLYPPFLVQTVSVGCEPCPRDSYTLGAGSWLGTERRDAACLPCPYGATCEAGGSGVVAKPGYKGEVSGSEGEIGAPCAEHREGPLCGSCAPGSSAALFTDACRDDGACGTAGALAQVSVLVLVAAAAYAIYLYYLPSSYASDMSLCVYFWQNCFVVLQTGGSLDRLSADAAGVARAVGDVARVRLSLGGSRGYCLYAGATTVAMIALNFVVPVAVLLATLLLHTVALRRRPRAATARSTRRSAAAPRPPRRGSRRRS
ncbi:hypothetical protein JL720_3696 [Aureococcus anophagefferens]|nr:hypothetical protein JL720_3696 [Aureococcus anophagefferens]